MKRQDANEPSGRFKLEVIGHDFPTRQSLAKSSTLQLRVRNADTKTVPNVAVTICNTTCSYRARRGHGSTVEPFSYAIANAPKFINAYAAR